jgi:hypothetical protein
MKASHKKRPGEIEGDSIYTQALCSTSYVTSNLVIKLLFQNIILSFYDVITFFNNKQQLYWDKMNFYDYNLLIINKLLLSYLSGRLT